MHEIRKEFEDWYEADAMPSEADWFTRDEQFPDMYDNPVVQSAWEGWYAAFNYYVD